METIRGKRALITGAGSGIGQAIALALAKEGADVCLVGRDEAKLKATAAQAGGHGVEIMIICCDLTQPAEITATVKSILSKWSGLDILVNNAGVAYYGQTELMTTPQFDQILSTNLLAPIQLFRELLPTFIEQRQAHILNISSIFGLLTMRKGAVYHASKSGLIGFSNAVRSEFWRGGIDVTVLCPGFVCTPMLEQFEVGMSGQKRHAIPRWACSTPERVADVAIRAIRKRKGLVVVPAYWRLMWLFPALFDWVMREGWRKPTRDSAGRAVAKRREAAAPVGPRDVSDAPALALMTGRTQETVGPSDRP